MSTEKASTATAVVAGAGDVQAVPAEAHLRLLGFSCEETASGSAKFRLRNGTSDTDPILFTIGLNAGETTREWFGPGGIKADGGIFIERVSGSTALTVFTRADD